MKQMCTMSATGKMHELVVYSNLEGFIEKQTVMHRTALEARHHEVSIYRYPANRRS